MGGWLGDCSLEWCIVFYYCGGWFGGRVVVYTHTKWWSIIFIIRSSVKVKATLSIESKTERISSGQFTLTLKTFQLKVGVSFGVFIFRCVSSWVTYMYVNVR